MKCPNISRWVALLLCAVALPRPGRAEDPAVTSALDKAEVRIPYLELRKLWESAAAATHIKEPEAPPQGALLSAQYAADLKEAQVALAAEFKVENFSGKWERIRLMGAGPAVADVAPADVRLVVEDGDLCVMVKDAGPLTVNVRFVPAPLPPAGDTPFLMLDLAPSAVASLRISNPPQGRLPKSKNSILTADAEGNCSLALPAKGGALALTLTDAAMAPKVEPPPPPPQPSEWNLQNEVLVFEGEGELNYRIRTHAIAQSGSALEASLLLPPNVRGVKVEGDDLTDFRLARQRDGQTELRLRWHTRDQMEREVKLTYALQQPPLAGEWELRAPSLPEEDRVKSLFMFALPAGVEFKAPNLQSPLPPARLPKWVGAETNAPEFGAIPGGATVKLQNRVLPRLETAVAIVTKAEYTTRLTDDGSTLTEAALEIEHEDALLWSFTLPEKCELLKCALDGAPLKPIARENGVMEIPLGHAAGTKTETSKVSFSYTAASGRLQAVEGAAALELPLTPIFIREVGWSVEMPPSYEVTGVDPPEMAAHSAANTSPNSIGLVRKLCRNERPQVQLFYKKRGIE